MYVIDLKELKINENRQRREMGEEELQELVVSIETIGLMHPPVIRSEGGCHVLVAGERRVKAIQQIYDLGGSFKCGDMTFGGADNKLLPCLNLYALSPLEAYEAELDENIRRKDLTWQEQAAALKSLHDLRRAQELGMEEVGREEELNKSSHSVADTALEVEGSREGGYQERTRKKLIVAKYLDDPDVAGAKTVDEAFKLLKQQEERKKREELAVQVGASFSKERHSAINAECLEWMRDCSMSFDVILTDPPYGIGADKFNDAAGKRQGIEHRYQDTLEGWQELMHRWTTLAFKVANTQAHAYVFCGIDRFHELKGYMEIAGWDVFRTPLIAHKINPGRVPRPEHGPRRQYELILYAIKGNKTVNGIYPDVISTRADENMSHGAQKPVALYQNLLQRSVKPGDKVLDTFAGSGTIFEAAHILQCAATGIEKEAEYYGMCLERIEKLK